MAQFSPKYGQRLGIFVGGLGLLSALLLGVVPVQASPVGGKRAAVLPPFASSAKTGSESPSTHAGTAGGEYGFAWDLHGGASTAVYPRFVTGDGSITMRVTSVSALASAGSQVEVEVKVDGTVVGLVRYTHLVSVKVDTNNDDSDGKKTVVKTNTVLGYTAPDKNYTTSAGTCKGFPCDSTNWKVTTTAGIHVHMAFKKACYASLGLSQSVGASTGIGLLSKNYGTTNKSGCDAGELASVVAGNSSAPYLEGSYIRASDTGRVYVMAGDAPMYVSDWSHVGGQPATIGTATQAQINALPDYPTDGSYIRDGVTNRVYVVAGGSALYISDWAHVGGQKAATKVDGWVLTNQLRAYPLNGAYLKDGVTGRVYVIAGGSALYISDWNNVGGPESATVFDGGALANEFLAYPVDGTFIKDGVTGRVYVLAGGAPLYISDWDNVGGVQSAVVVDGGVLTSKLRALPLDSTFVRDGSNGRVYVIAGGSALYISDWAHVGGQKPAVTVDGDTLAAQLLTYPQDGTLVKAYISQAEYQIVGQQAQYIEDPSQVGGTRVIIDDEALYNQLGVAR